MTSACVRQACSPVPTSNAQNLPQAGVSTQQVGALLRKGKRYCTVTHPHPTAWLSPMHASQPSRVLQGLLQDDSSQSLCTVELASPHCWLDPHHLAPARCEAYATWQRDAPQQRGNEPARWHTEAVCSAVLSGAARAWCQGDSEPKPTPRTHMSQVAHCAGSVSHPFALHCCGRWPSLGMQMSTSLSVHSLQGNAQVSLRLQAPRRKHGRHDCTYPQQSVARQASQELPASLQLLMAVPAHIHCPLPRQVSKSGQ